MLLVGTGLLVLFSKWPETLIEEAQCTFFILSERGDLKVCFFVCLLLLFAVFVLGWIKVERKMNSGEK